MGSNYTNFELQEEHEDSLFGFYIQSANYVDKALEMFFNELKENGLYDNSIFVKSLQSEKHLSWISFTLLGIIISFIPQL